MKVNYRENLRYRRRNFEKVEYDVDIFYFYVIEKLFLCRWLF